MFLSYFLPTNVSKEPHTNKLTKYTNRVTETKSTVRKSENHRITKSSNRVIESGENLSQRPTVPKSQMPA